MAETNEFYIKIGADVNDATTKLNQLSSQLSQLASSTQRSGNQISNSMGGASRAISSAFGAMGLALTAAGITSAIIGIGKSALTTAAQLQQTKVAFEVFTGSAIAADAILSQLKEQAIKSPMQFQDIVKGSQTLMQYGLNAKQTVEISRMLGDISGGNADKFQRLSLAFGQVAASGRLMGQEARQMINAGFNPLQVISEKTGVSMAVLTQRMHDGQISVKEVADAFIYATSEGGRFFGMADKQSKTLSGAYNKMSESISFSLAEMGENIARSLDLSGVAEHISGLVAKIGENFKNTSGQMKNSAYWGEALKWVLSDLALFIDLCIKGFQGLGSAIEKVFTSDDLNRFSNWLDEATIKIAGLFGETAQKNVRDFLGYVNSFGKPNEKGNGLPTELGSAIPEMEKRADALRKKMEWQFTVDISGYNTTVKQLKALENQIEVLKKTTGRANALDLGFSATPSKKPEKKTATQKYETVAFPDFITKEVGAKIKAFIQENKDAANTISNWWSTSESKRLAELKKNYEKDVAFANKYGLDLTDIERKYNSERNLIVQKFAEGKVTAREDARKKMIEQSTRDVADALKKDSLTLNGLFTTLKADDARNSLGKFAQSIYSAQRDFAMNISVGFAEIAGAALAGAFNVQDAFKALGSMFVGAIGDLLIKVGTAAIELGLFKEGIETALKSLGGGAGMVALGIAAIAAGSALKSYSGKITDSMSNNKSQVSSASRSSGASGMTSGSSYQYGGSSYATQSVKLSIDLTGAITATQTGYQINKSLETVLRVTGR